MEAGRKEAFAHNVEEGLNRQEVDQRPGTVGRDLHQQLLICIDYLLPSAVHTDPYLISACTPAKALPSLETTCVHSCELATTSFPVIVMWPEFY